MVELREVQVFFALADELHFGHAAERLGVTPSRVSQIIRDLERKLGGELFSRTSRTVTLTRLGEQFLAETKPPHDELLAAFRRVHAANQGIDGTLRLGLLAANAGGPHLSAIIETFERRHRECEVVLTEIFFADPLGPLRRGEIDILATRLPLDQPDLTIGPTLAREARVLAVAHDHPLAARKTVSIEDVADYAVAPITDEPKELIDAAIPYRTPAGRPIRRLARRPRTPHEVTAMIARGRIVHPTFASFAQFFGQPGITYVPIHDMPSMKSGLVWRRRATNSRLRAFVRVAREVLASRRDDEAAKRRRRKQHSRRIIKDSFTVA